MRGDWFKVATWSASTAIWIATCGRPDVADVKKLQRVPSPLGSSLSRRPSSGPANGVPQKITWNDRGGAGRGGVGRGRAGRALRSGQQHDVNSAGHTLTDGRTQRGALHCCFGQCRPDERCPEKYKGISLFPFPKPKRRLEDHKAWTRACSRHTRPASARLRGRG